MESATANEIGAEPAPRIQPNDQVRGYRIDACDAIWYSCSAKCTSAQSEVVVAELATMPNSGVKLKPAPGTDVKARVKAAIRVLRGSVNSPPTCLHSARRQYL